MILDGRGIEINQDYYVRYTETGTVGKVVDLKTENKSNWVKLDKTGLWYLSNLVEVLDSKDLKLNDNNDKERDKVTIEDIKNRRTDLENVELASNVAEGGG